MLTEMALSNGVVVNEMDIAMPSLGEYTQAYGLQQDV